MDEMLLAKVFEKIENTYQGDFSELQTCFKDLDEILKGVAYGFIIKQHYVILGHTK